MIVISSDNEKILINSSLKVCYEKNLFLVSEFSYNELPPIYQNRKNISYEDFYSCFYSGMKRDVMDYILKDECFFIYNLNKFNSLFNVPDLPSCVKGFSLLMND
jgi:hypothetical protein